MVSCYSNIIAIRSSHVGDALTAAEYSSVPVINAGDGTGEHPTQALLDLYTITKRFDLFSGTPVRVTFVGDLLYGRTVHSLSLLLRNFPHVTITFVSPESLCIPSNYSRPSDTVVSSLTDEILRTSDVIYMTRVQKERFPDVASYEAIKNSFIFDLDTARKMREDALLMHPFPRVHEIDFAVDSLPQAAYFEQAKNGVPMRMALIKYCLEG